MTVGLIEIKGICLQKEGVKNMYQDTIHYKVLISFTQELPIRVLETKSRTTAIEKVKEIRNFLGLSTEVLIKDRVLGC